MATRPRKPSEQLIDALDDFGAACMTLSHPPSVREIRETKLKVLELIVKELNESDSN